MTNQVLPAKTSSTHLMSFAYGFVVLLITLAYTSGKLSNLMASYGITQFQEHYLFAVMVLLGGIAISLGGSSAAIMVLGSIGSFIVLSFHCQPLLRYLILAALLFAIGMYGMVSSRNAVRVLMSIELMLNAVNINLVAFAHYIDPFEIKGQLFAVFILTVAAAEAAVGLAIVLAIYRNMSTVDMERFNLLKW